MNRRALGEWGRVTALALIVFAVAGAAWGWWQPVTTGEVTDDLTAVTGLSGEDAPVTAFGMYVIVTGILGAALAGWMFAAARSLRGPVALLGAGVLSFLGSGVFLLFGGYVTSHFRATDLDGDLVAGQQVTLVADVGAGVGFLVAPAAAVLVYWACALFSSDRAFERSL
ncbi:hypothetical protein Csp1_16130 [Corynebacterium provencense]|jgi:hypothetical protein|uniref:DUF2567 domain-containing protein n=1 Tax=Corynebacterium provencense TaxID=1737425 RepID=A0A2Z3YWH7_9CORY|nr:MULTISPECIES: hypothetical protein [Corynebacterium]AWT26397.1 hypothetical protein Csp1_16130 [Corynebacterium provencense]MCI1256519.1 hypothetical protein [Corynebacterium provencense]